MRDYSNSKAYLQAFFGGVVSIITLGLVTPHLIREDQQKSPLSTELRSGTIFGDFNKVARDLTVALRKYQMKA